MTMALLCGLSVLLIVGGSLGLLALTKRTEPTGCMIFIGLMFLVCLAGLIVPQLLQRL
ncbi:MAG: hypothetical protein AAF629_05175 [Chloroflexota bacterium]